MSQDQNQNERRNLDPLPPDDDKEFWGDAEVHIITPQDVWSDGPHYFERVSGHQAECKHCNWGFQLEPGDRIVEGHLYSKEGKLVI